ncbi:MAG: histidine--tRNA ligase [Candidatus Lightella neohaematopini]|nr:histidine--tRNA ligase [Candidatus Lightella neohaematopini]
MKIVNSVKGMHDLLPKDSIIWQQVEYVIKNTLLNYGYREIRFPIVEKTKLFNRAIGYNNLVINKEMYNFYDRNGCSLSLRPEGTASCIRAIIEHGLLYNKQRLWYHGPMFRYEKPQMGRFRQFHQIGIEVFGYSDVCIDIELILLISRIWKLLGLSKYLSLEINSLGCLKTRKRYYKELITFFQKNKLLNNIHNSIINNPMRLLEKYKTLSILKQAPLITNYLDNESHNRFLNLQKSLNNMNISYNINPYLVRGLDYYNDTVFEWTTSNLGSQNTICGGGRYDLLVSNFNYNHSIPAIGCAIGLERLIILINKNNILSKDKFLIDVFLVNVNNKLKNSIISLSEYLRDSIPSLKLVVDFYCNKISKYRKQAYQLKTKILIIMGDNALLSDQLILENLVINKKEIIKKSYILSKLLLILFNNN